MPSALTIERMSNVYRVAADDPAPDEVRSRLDRLAVDEVVHACRNRLAELLNDGDPSIWLIRSLEVDLAVDAGAYAAQRAGFAWGEKLAIEIGHVLEQGPGESVVHFPSRVAYVAQWARDVASGRTWGKWYYADFDSLRSLPQSAAIAEGILRESDVPKILLRLHTDEALNPVLATLTSHDADRLYRSLASGDRRIEEAARWASRLLAIWNSALNSKSQVADQLRLWAAAATEWPGDFAGLQYAIDQLLDVRSLLAQIGSTELSGEVLAEAITGNVEKTRPLLAERQIQQNDELLNFVRAASGGNPDWAGFAASAIALGGGKNREESFLSEFGGVFLLASAFCDLQVHHAINAAAGGASNLPRAAAILRFLLVVRCLGASRAASAIHDRAVMEFAGLTGSVTLHEMASIFKAANAHSALSIVEDAMNDLYGERHDEKVEPHNNYFAIGNVFAELEIEAGDEEAWSRIAVLILRTFANRLPGFARSSAEYLFRNFLAGTAQLRVGENAIKVIMGDRPLAVVLHIAGAYRRLALPWREGVEICLLTPPD